MKYKQNNIKINGITLPKIKYKKTIYYPLSYVYDKILLKSKQNISLLKERGYEDDLKQFDVDFNFNNAGTQNTYCISKEGLIRLLESSNVGGLTVEQKRGMNSMLNHLGLDLIDEKPRYLDKINYKNNNTYDEFEKDCIEETLKLDNTLKWQICKDCGKYYPLHTNFFSYNTRDNIFSTTCRNCRNIDVRHRIGHPNNYLNHIYNTYGNNVYILYKNHDTMGIYHHYIDTKLSSFPKILLNKEDVLTIIKFLYNNKKINKDNLTISLLKEKYGLKSITVYLTQEDIYEYLFGSHPKNYPWHYDSYMLKNLSFEEAKIILNNYLVENNLNKLNIYELDYENILRKSRLISKYGGNVLSFVMDYYENKYAAYRFKTNSVNYWKDKENRDRALKYLIEEDMKLEIKKIPLYVTITSIRNIGTTTMYNVLKNYYSSLYEWVNEVYPDVFEPKDFDINYMRNEFDSEDEQVIDDILRNNFDNVLYNPKHNVYTITLVGKIPDWFIFTETGVIIVEYFGLWAKEREMYNSRTRDYIVRSKDKIEKYKSLEGYRFLYIFPEDLDNNFEGLHKKIELIKEN